LKQTLSFKKIAIDQIPWEVLDAFEDRLVFQTSAWIEFLTKYQNAQPVCYAILLDDDRIGFFTGCEIRKGPFRILGAPLKGWATDYMGFNLTADAAIKKEDILAPLLELLHKTYHYIEFCAPDLNVDLLNKIPDIVCQKYGNFEIDLTLEYPEIKKKMSKATRNFVNRAERYGLTTLTDNREEHAEFFYDCLGEVFARQKKQVPFGIDRVKCLLSSLCKDDKVQVVICSADGKQIGIGIFVGYGQRVVLWGLAGRQEAMDQHPYEPILWHGIHYWKERGACVLDMGGGGSYKKKYGGVPTEMARILAPKWKFLLILRNFYSKVVIISNRIKSMLRK
jgi:hypothetical protein